YNAPTASQVAAICFDRSVIIYATGDRPTCIKAYHVNATFNAPDHNDTRSVNNEHTGT
ncbi:hypothetical protein ACJX0J_006118, partial [Zea mays]